MEKRLADAIENLIDAIPAQTNDCDWWSKEIQQAVDNGKHVLSLTDMPDRMPAQFIKTKTRQPAAYGNYYVIIKTAGIISTFRRKMIYWADESFWGIRKDEEVTEWLCEDPDIIDEVNAAL